MSGPQLTQRKITKLRDALNVVRECDQIQRSVTLVVFFEAMLAGCDDLTRMLKEGRD